MIVDKRIVDWDFEQPITFGQLSKDKRIVDWDFG
jgi:hypothetical protein